MDFLTCDFHTHLDQYPFKKLTSQLNEFDGILVSASMDLLSYKKNCRLEAKLRKKACSTVKIVPTFGIHPKYAEYASRRLEKNPHYYDKYCQNSSIIGEIGMDFCWYKDASPDKQEKVFRYFLEHCEKTHKFCVIHTKDAEKEVCNILKDYPNARPIIHWYDGDEKTFEEFIARGYYQTFGCETSRSEKLKAFLRSTPKHLILAETDNPESEIWLGGTDNSVFLIERIYKDIADCLETSFEEACYIINENSKRILSYANLTYKCSRRQQASSRQ